MDENVKKVSSKDFAKFFWEFYSHKYPNQRFGQAFLNHFYPERIESDIFYEENWTIAFTKISEKFVNFEVKNEG